MTDTPAVATGETSTESTARELEPASNHYMTRRHLSDDLAAKHDRAGRRGFSLCSTVANPVEVMDQAEHDYWSQRYERRDAKSIESLPLCKKCDSKAKRSGASR